MIIFYLGGTFDVDYIITNCFLEFGHTVCALVGKSVEL